MNKKNILIIIMASLLVSQINLKTYSKDFFDTYEQYLDRYSSIKNRLQTTVNNTTKVKTGNYSYSVPVQNQYQQPYYGQQGMPIQQSGYQQGNYYPQQYNYGGYPNQNASQQGQQNYSGGTPSPMPSAMNSIYGGGTTGGYGEGQGHSTNVTSTEGASQSGNRSNPGSYENIIPKEAIVTVDGSTNYSFQFQKTKDQVIYALVQIEQQQPDGSTKKSSKYVVTDKQTGKSKEVTIFTKYDKTGNQIGKPQIKGNVGDLNWNDLDVSEEMDNYKQQRDENLAGKEGAGGAESVGGNSSQSGGSASNSSSGMAQGGLLLSVEAIKPYETLGNTMFSIVKKYMNAQCGQQSASSITGLLSQSPQQKMEPGKLIASLSNGDSTVKSKWTKINLEEVTQKSNGYWDAAFSVMTRHQTQDGILNWEFMVYLDYYKGKWGIYYVLPGMPEYAE